MNQGRYRWWLRLTVLLAVGIAALLWAKREPSPTILIIQNRSGQSISLLEVTLAGETRQFQNVQDGSDVRVSLIKMDTPLVLTGRLADDTRIKASFGQIPGGPAGEPPTLIVVPGGQIMVRQGNKNSP
jgi:hypothetical protein